MKEIELTVEGMSCEGCEKAVQNALGRLENVGSVRADHSSGRVTIEASGDVDLETARRAVDEAGYTIP